ncbi:MAG: hypothetical protein FJ267_14985 [Planctomycetes bacterium]|nr:hypothetical protein [Planctomycetota bacterium]
MRAGTLILATSILVWGLSYFPGNHSEQQRLESEIGRQREQFSSELEHRDRLLKEKESITLNGIEESSRSKQYEQDQEQAVRLGEISKELDRLEPTLRPLDEIVEKRNRVSEELLESSFLGRLGKGIEPAIRPLGWDWRIGVGVLASFPAREVVVSALGTIYSLGEEIEENDSNLQQAMRESRWTDGRPVYSMAVAASIMVFFALCSQCMSTLVVIRRETNSWFWSIFTFCYMTGLAYLGAMFVYQVGTWMRT